MNHYIMIRRLRWPAFLLLLGVIALLAQTHVLRWGQSWPLILIVLGVLLLAERAALAMEVVPPYPYGSNPAVPQAAPPAAQPASTAIVPSDSHSDVDGQTGAQS